MKTILGVLLALTPASALADKSFNAGTGATWDCARDAAVRVNTSNGTYTFKGACKDINLNGSNLTVSIDSVEDLSINGSRNTVTVTTLAELGINGADNAVRYARGARGAPKVTNLGRNNTVEAAALATPTLMDCAKQPNVSIAKGKGSYKLVGTCTKVTISGGSNTVTIEATKNLAITGSRNEVRVDKVDKIAALGSNNRVAYRGGLSIAAPKVAAMGKGNTVTQAGAAPSGGAATATTSGTAVVVAIDCAKTPSHSIDDNNGTYAYRGSCELIAISGHNNKVTAESAKLLTITGDNNKVSAVAVDRVSTTGNDNVASWKVGISRPRPALANTGKRNKLAKSK